MKENHEVINDEELKRFFLIESQFLALPTKQGKREYDRLRILYRMQKSFNELLYLLYQCDLGTHYLDICQVFGFYFVEKEGEKKKKHRMSASLHTYTCFMQQLMKSENLITNYLLYNAKQMDELERIASIYYHKNIQKEKTENNVLPREEPSEK